MRRLIPLLLIAVAGCRTPQALQKSAVKSAVVPAPTSFTLTWRYAITTNITFEVWETDDLGKPWAEVGVTSSTNWVFYPTNAAGFFKVRASNTVNGMESQWAT